MSRDRSDPVAGLMPAGVAVGLSAPGLWLTGLERGLMLAGLSLALGGLAGRGLSRQYKGARPGPLPPPWALRGSLLGLCASAALLITAVVGPGVAAALAQPPPPGLRSGGTARVAAAELVLFAVAALLFRLRRSGLGALMLSGVVLAEGIRSHPEGVLPVAGALLTYCHLLPAVLWAGMLCYALRAGIAWRGNPAAAHGIMRLYATAAAWLFALVLGTGLISALVLVPLGSLLTTSYGLFLIAKAAVVCVAAILAVASRRWLRRRPASGSGPPLGTRLELGALAVVLAITGILTVLTPPAKQGSAPSAAPTASKQILLTSGVYHGVWWGVWAWTDGGTLCMDMAGRGGPDEATPPAEDAAGGACGFARTPTYPHFYDSGPGPVGSDFSMGPLPATATQIRVATHEILSAAPFPAGFGLPVGRYWVEIIPANGFPKADGAPLDTPQPLNALGQPVPFKAY